jgi:hypothetical protein
MPQNITPKHLGAQATSVKLRGVTISYDTNEAVEGGYVTIGFYDAGGAQIDQENVHFTPAQFSAWNGSVAQARTFAINNSRHAPQVV